MNILCIIPARGKSKGLRNKNIMPLCGKPLMAYTIEAALDSALIDRIVVSTEDEKIAKVARSYQLRVIKRPKKYASDTAPIEQALCHAVECLEKDGYRAEMVVWLQANNPIRKRGQIDNVIRRLLSTNADSAATVYRVDQFPQWMKKMTKKGMLLPLSLGVEKYRRQDIEPLFLLDGSVLAMKIKPFLNSKNKKGLHVYLGKKVLGVIEDKKYSLEIHDYDDFQQAEAVLKKIKKNQAA